MKPDELRLDELLLARCIINGPGIRELRGRLESYHNGEGAVEFVQAHADTLETGVWINVAFTGSDALYQWPALITRSSPGRIQVQFGEGPARVQRREYARTDCYLTALCHLESGENLVGICRDISGGGAQVAFGEPLEPETTPNITINLKEDQQVKLKARIIACWTDKAASKHLQHRCRLEFLDVPEMVRRELVRFVFDKMAETLRKEAG